MYYPKASHRRRYHIENQSKDPKKQKEHSKVLLPPSWSGLVTVGEPSKPPPKQQGNFSMGLWNINAHSHFRGVIFRNSTPIEEIRPYKPCSTNKDALKSLRSLDSRLQKEFQNSLLPDKSDDYDDYDDLSGNASSQVIDNEVWKERALPRNIVREFDVTKISPRGKKSADDESPVTYKDLRRETSVTTISSFKLNFDGLDSSKKNLLKPPSFKKASSVYSDHSDAQSLASSTGSLMFASYESRKEAYDAIKSPRYDEEQLSEVSKLVRQLSDHEGRKRNQRFEGEFGKLCDVVNAVLQKIPANILPFKVKKLKKDCTYETMGVSSYDFYLEAEISREDFEVCFHQEKSNIADVILTRANPTFELFCVEDTGGTKRKLSPCKLMIIFAHMINAAAKNKDLKFPHDANVCYESISDKDTHISVTFPDTNSRFVVNFILAMDVEDFPTETALKRTRRQWPSIAVKHQIQKKGVHLTSKLNEFDLHSWTVTFLKSRRTLLQLTDETGNKLRLLLALQCLRETNLSNPDVILPAHFATILFWANIKYTAPIEWTTLKLGKRFIDLVLALRRCLWKRECLDFFVPHVNLLEKLNLEHCRTLSVKIDTLINDPVGYLKAKLI